MKKLFLIVGILFGFAAAAQTINDVRVYAQKTIDSAITEIFTKSVPPEKREAPFRKVLNDNFNFDYISNFILGVYSRDLSEKDRQDFIKAFAELNTKSYVKKFANYADAPIEITEVKSAKKDGEYMVTSKTHSDDKDYEIVWRIQRLGSGYKVIDIIVEGVSMAMSYKQEYASILKDASTAGTPPVPALTKKIYEKIKSID